MPSSRHDSEHSWPEYATERPTRLTDEEVQVLRGAERLEADREPVAVGTVARSYRLEDARAVEILNSVLEHRSVDLVQQPIVNVHHAIGVWSIPGSTETGFVGFLSWFERGRFNVPSLRRGRPRRVRLCSTFTRPEPAGLRARGGLRTRRAGCRRCSSEAGGGCTSRSIARSRTRADRGFARRGRRSARS